MTRVCLHLLILLFFFLLSICSTSSFSSASRTFTVNPSKVKQISWNPRAFVYQGLLTDAECDHLISIAKSELKRSAVVDNLSGQSKLSEIIIGHKSDDKSKGFYRCPVEKSVRSLMNVPFTLKKAELKAEFVKEEMVHFS